MQKTIKIRRGLKADLPAEGVLAEFFWCTDTHELFAGQGTGNPLVEVAADAVLIQGTAVLDQAPDDGQVLIFDQATGKYVPGDPIVSGPDAVGGAPTRNPVQVGLLDSSGNVQALAKDASGGIPVTPSLPTGASTAARQDTGNTFLAAIQTSVASIDTKTPSSPATSGKQDTGNTSLATIATAQGAQGNSLDPPTGGSGILGFLSGIYSRLAGVVLAAGTALIGQVSASPETSTIFNGTTALTPLFKNLTASSSGAQTLIAAVSAKKIRVLALSLVANAAVNVKFQSHVTPTDISGLYYCAANGGFVLPFNPAGWFETVSGEALDINLSSAVAVGGSIVYVTV